MEPSAVRCGSLFGLELTVHLKCSMLRDAALVGYMIQIFLQQEETGRL